MTDHIKIILEAAGCTKIVHESEQMSNVTISNLQPTPDDIIGIVKEPETLLFKTGSNGVRTEYPPIIVEIIKMVVAESPAETNKTTLDLCANTARKFIHLLIRSGSYQRITDVRATKVTERKYDANVIGWSLPLTLKPIANESVCE